MSEISSDRLAEMIWGRLSGVDGVCSIFAPHAAPTISGVVSRPTSGRTQTVRLSAGASVLVVSARVGTDRHVPARQVIAAAVAALDEVLGPRPYELDLEIAVIE